MVTLSEVPPNKQRLSQESPCPDSCHPAVIHPSRFSFSSFIYLMLSCNCCCLDEEQQVPHDVPHTEICGPHSCGRSAGSIWRTSYGNLWPSAVATCGMMAACSRWLSTAARSPSWKASDLSRTAAAARPLANMAIMPPVATSADPTTSPGPAAGTCSHHKHACGLNFV